MRLTFVDKLSENISVGKYFTFCRQKIGEVGIEELETELMASSVDALTLKLQRMKQQVLQKQIA